MRFFFMGPRFLGIRPGISFSPNDFRKAVAPKSAGNMTGSFVYVIEGEAGKHKIGVSTNPIQRISELQTGSPFPLKFAYIGATPGAGYDIEDSAHQMLDQYRTVGEWFRVPASIAIGSALEAARRLNQPIQQVQPEMVPQIIYLANQPDQKPKRSIWFYLQLVVGSAIGLVFALVINFLIHSGS